MRKIRHLALGLAAVLTASSAAAVDLRYGSKGVPVSFGNPYMANGSPSSYVWFAMFDALTQIDGKGQLQPALAQSWEAIEPKAWKFKLKPNIAFSNGEPFNADAVTTAIAWLKTPEGRRSVIGGEIRDVVGAEKVDDLTVIIRTEKPDAILPRRMSAVLLGAPKAWTKLGPEGFAKTPATTGSFMIKDWSEGGGRIILDAFKQSWRAPIVDRLVIINLPDNPARMQALQSNQIDIAGNINVDDIDTVEASNGRVVSGSSASVAAIAFRIADGQNKALKDVRVRQALNYAIDKDMMNTALLRGFTPPSGQPAAIGAVGYDPGIKPYPYDVAKAKALLKEAGFANGFPLRVEVMVDRTPGDAAVYQTMADMLKQIGVKVELRTITFPSWLSKYLTGTFDKDTDAFTLSWNAAPYNDVQRPMEIYSCLWPKPFFCDDGLTKQLVAAGEQMDLVKREAMLRTLGQGYHDAAPALFLLNLNDFFGVRAGVDDVEIVNRVPAYHKIKISKPR
ncbi:MAG: ABC transporter substrate-binding protein [Rhodospirillaceae bacterium]|nr:ABC transporter substrate-binding protein [Rhodospirillaceae bacterium]